MTSKNLNHELQDGSMNKLIVIFFIFNIVEKNFSNKLNY